MNLSIEKLLSAETLQKFKVYEDLLRLWNQRTALVQKDTLADFRSRHILDSLQLVPIMESLGSAPVSLPEFDRQALPASTPSSGWQSLDLASPLKDSLSIVDIGSGAGFPGMVLAMCGFKNVTLCESNQKKCIFLKEVARQTNTTVRIVNDRVESLTQKFDLVVSRACTDLEGLLEMMEQLASPLSSYALFHKGRSWQEEIMTAQENWLFSGTVVKSVTSQESVILCLSSPRRKPSGSF